MSDAPLDPDTMLQLEATAQRVMTYMPDGKRKNDLLLSLARAMAFFSQDGDVPTLWTAVGVAGGATPVVHRAGLVGPAPLRGMPEGPACEIP